MRRALSRSRLTASQLDEDSSRGNALPGMRVMTVIDGDGLRTPAYWLDRAEEARARADEMRDEEARLAMENIALMYEALGERAARRLRAAVPDW